MMTGSWLPLTVLCAWCLATSDAFSKKAINAGHDRYVIAWLRITLMLPVFWVLALSYPFPSVHPDFYQTVLVALPLETLAFLLYMKAIAVSPLSLTLPFLALTPVFLLFVPRMLLGETVNGGGVTGIALIAAGAYMLNLGSLRNGILGPIRAIGKEPGSRYMILVAFLFSITATLGKKAIAASSPFFFGAVYFTALSTVIMPFAFRTGWRNVRRSIRGGLAPGLFSTGELVTHLMAITQAPVAYMISVKRLSLLAAVLYGHFIFGEEGFFERLAGTLLMVVGVAVIAVRG